MCSIKSINFQTKSIRAEHVFMGKDAVKERFLTKKMMFEIKSKIHLFENSFSKATVNLTSREMLDDAKL